MSQTYLTTNELAARIKYNPRTIREQLKDSVLLEGIHPYRRAVDRAPRSTHNPTFTSVNACIKISPTHSVSEAL